MDMDPREQGVIRSTKIREQVEYYLSDRNLQHDAYFCRLLAADQHGWVDADPHILQCPRMRWLNVSCKEVADALQFSELLEVENRPQDSGAHVVCRVRRKHPFLHQGLHKEMGEGTDKGKGKGKRAQEVPTYDKGKGHCKGKNKGKRERGGPTYDPSTPCGYFMAGFCRHGDRCAKQHSVPYALAIRHEWLHPGDTAARQLLQSAAEQVLGSAWLDSSRLFPRVFSQRLEAAKPKFTSCRHVPCDLSDLGFSWEAGGGEQCRARPQPDTLQPPPTQRLRYLLVLDLEGKDEITEFPVLAIDAVLKCELGRFQHYVQPVHLFDGCALTESSPAIPFTQLLTIFDGWLRSTLGRSLHDIGQRKADTAFVTCGDWDCKHVHTQCGISRIPVPAAFSQWVNIKRLYSDTYGGDFRGMKSMLSRLCLLDSKGDPKFGFHHLGMHDVENIGRCLMHLLEHNVEVAINGWKK